MVLTYGHPARIIRTTSFGADVKNYFKAYSLKKQLVLLSMLFWSAIASLLSSGGIGKANLWFDLVVVAR
jgi:hypothetical protein